MFSFVSVAVRRRVAVLLAVLFALSVFIAPATYADSSTNINGYPGQSYRLVTQQLPGQEADIQVLVQTCNGSCYYWIQSYKGLRCGVSPCYRYTDVYVASNTRVVSVNVYSWGGYLANWYGI